MAVETLSVPDVETIEFEDHDDITWHLVKDEAKQLSWCGTTYQFYIPSTAPFSNRPCKKCIEARQGRVET